MYTDDLSNFSVNASMIMLMIIAFLPFLFNVLKWLCGACITVFTCISEGSLNALKVSTLKSTTDVLRSFNHVIWALVLLSETIRASYELLKGLILLYKTSTEFLSGIS